MANMRFKQCINLVSYLNVTLKADLRLMLIIALGCSKFALHFSGPVVQYYVHLEQIK